MAESKYVHLFEPSNYLPLNLTLPFNAKRPWEISQDVRWRYGKWDETIPAGFRCDLASIPHWLWWIPGMSPIGPHARAAAIHNLLYQRGIVSRVMADAWFRDIMRADGVDVVRRNALYFGVRLGGGKAWRRHRERKA